MGSAISSCQWLVDDGSSEYRNSNGLMLASRKNIKPSRIPLSQLCLSDVIIENETTDVSKTILGINKKKESKLTLVHFDQTSDSIKFINFLRNFLFLVFAKVLFRIKII